MEHDQANPEAVQATPMEPAPVPATTSGHMPTRLTPENLAAVEENIRMLQELKLMAISGTNPQDWILIADRPYPLDAARSKMASLFGVSFTDIRYEADNYEDERGPVKGYIVLLKAHFRGNVIEETGSAYSCEQFFNRRAECDCKKNKDCPKCHGRGRYTKRLPLSEIPVGNVRKKAVTNAKGRAFRTILGINFTKEDLHIGLQKGGKDPSKLTGYSFKAPAGKKKAPAKKKPAAPFDQAPDELTPEEYRQEIHNMAMQFANGDESQVPGIIDYFTSWEKDGKQMPGKDKVQDISDKQAPVTYREMRKVAKEKGFIE